MIISYSDVNGDTLSFQADERGVFLKADTKNKGWVCFNREGAISLALEILRGASAIKKEPAQ